MKRVLVQAGHNPPLEPGFERGTGTRGEAELVHTIAHELIDRLAADPHLEPVHAHGDIPDGVRVDAAVFLHADGSSNPDARGYSFGYSPRGDPAQPHPRTAASLRLADLVAAQFEAIGHPGHRRGDNYTRNLAGYYGFRRVDSAGPELVIEHGFLTSPAERAWLLANAAKLAVAEHRALRRFFGLRADAERPPARRPRPPWLDLPGPSPKLPWFWDALREWERRHGRAA